MKKLVILTGSGISAESGLKTFRETGGLWEDYDVMQVASIEGWIANPALVLKFYNERRAQLSTVEPNRGHYGLVELEKFFDVQIVTQNVDNLHERAGSQKVLHLHGELTKVQSTGDSSYIIDIGTASINLGDTCPKGHQLRPHIVWFGEMVPAITEAAQMVSSADILVIIGTSLVVYPAAGLIEYARPNVPIYLIDPNNVSAPRYHQVHFIKKKAGKGVDILLKELIH